MRFGLSFLPDASPSTKPAVDYFSDALELSRIADRGGFSRVKITEHYLHPYGGYCPSPLGFLSAVAAQTQAIRLLTGCITASFHHPVQIAAETAMVDAISGGRLDVGFARGFSPFEFEAFGIDLDDSRIRFKKTLEAVQRLWTEEHVSMSTPFFELKELRSLPRPVQSPHPPLWGAAARSRESFAWIGERGMHLLTALTSQSALQLAEQIRVYRESTDEDVLPEAKVAVLIPLYLAPSQREAIHEGDQFLTHYHRVWGDAAKAWDTTSSKAYPSYRGMAHSISSASPEALRKQRSVAFGAPSAVVEYLHWLIETLPVDEVLWNLDFGAMPMSRARRTLDLFLEKVAPYAPSRRSAATRSEEPLHRRPVAMPA